MECTTWFILLVMIELSRKVESSMKATVCVGNIFSLSCGNDQYILHILYEQYSYSPTDKCHYDPGHCSQAEIINPVSAQKCNGYSHCSFPIPSGFILQVCGSQNATSFTVFYDCFSKHQMIDVCKPYTAQNKQKLYLKSPDYPGDKLDPANCHCNITGQNITAEIYDHQKSHDSPVVFMFVTNKATIHVNDVNIRSEIIFSGMDYVELLLDNQDKQEVFKLWMEITGRNFRVIIVAVIAFTIIIIVFVAIGILVNRRNHGQDGGFTVTEPEHDRDVYHAYNFSLRNKYEKDFSNI
ncbi:uncharacterized protein LOC143048719 isoform X2 [Mytilus galloprovincialis]|uniref:uncharacterized protein LOC143048719 isoform X2 n=1 Tax=Mytilus galloprovincialis TaxID=29158 RepID=UPI003F7B49DD